MELNRIYKGDCLEVMKGIETNSIDSIVTDPPYGLEFMGKDWDKGVPNIKYWKEMFRILKHGGHLLSFGGTRTYHRMATAIEDAGFEIRDMINWVYGSGFPKSLNIGKAIDKLKGNDREIIGYTKDINHIERGDTNIDKQKDLSSDSIFSKRGYNLTTKGNSEYEGWGTGLKPAHEPIVVARKPLSEKTVALNVLKWGTGGINIDGCRVETTEDTSRKKSLVRDTQTGFGKGYKMGGNGHHQGRFPANFIHDGSKEVVELFPQTGKGGHPKKSNESLNNCMNGKNYERLRPQRINTDEGSASRFFYCAKASKSERNKGLENLDKKFLATMGNGIGKREHNKNEKSAFVKNNHPTVKPIKLMRYLVRLITPPNGIILDPFAGSGSTLIGAKLEGFNYIGIEMDEQYFDIMNGRIKYYELV